MRKILFSILFVAGCMTVSAQQKFMLPNANPQQKDTEREIEQYGGISILGVVNPSVEVRLYFVLVAVLGLYHGRRMW